MIKTNLRQTNIVALVLVVAMIFMAMPAQASFIRSDWEFGKRNVASTLTASADLTESIHLDLSMAFTGEMEKMSTTAKLDSLLETDVWYAKNLNNIEGHNDYVYQAKLSITWSL